MYSHSSTHDLVHMLKTYLDFPNLPLWCNFHCLQNYYIWKVSGPWIFSYYCTPLVMYKLKYTSSCCQINWWSNCFLIFKTAIFGTCLVHVSVATVWLGSVPLILAKFSSNNQAGYWLKQVVQSVPVLKLLNWLWPDELGNILLYLPSSFTTFIPL